MTHDPREALERICQRANETGGADTMALIDTIHAMHGIAREALTASAQKGEPCDMLTAETVAWSFIDYHQIPVGLHAALADLVRRARNDTSPPPAAGWDEAAERVQSAYDELCVRFSGVHSDDAMDSVLLRLHGALKALRREAPAPSGVVLADWSELPKDIYVIGARRVNAVGFDVQCCSVPMVTAPEVRYVRADMITATPSRPDAGGGVRVPQGYALVPAKPTPAMIEAGCEQNPTQWNEGTDLGFAADVANDVYVAMVRAATLSTPSDAVNESAEAPQWPANLHPLTLDLVKRFAVALAEKLCLAEEKYGYSDNWQRDDWKDDCQHKLIKHIVKGDPRDVAAYCAFMWHHGWPTILLDSDELAGCRAVLREATVKNAKQSAMIADLNDMVLRYAHRAETNESAPQPGNSYYTIQSALSPHIASSTELMAAMSSIWPLIKLPSVVNESAEAEEDETYEIGLRDGYEDAIQDLDIATGGDGEFKGSTIPGETVDVPVMKQRIIDRFASDESAEARLREALIALDERLRSCGGLHTAEDAYDSFYQDIVSEALSAGGDEAKKSEGSPANPDQGVASQHEHPDESRSGLNSSRNQSDPSDPPDRREIVARIKADPGDGTVSPDLAHVLARGFEAMGWQRPQNAAEDMIVALLAALEEVHDAR